MLNISIKKIPYNLLKKKKIIAKTHDIAQTMFFPLSSIIGRFTLKYPLKPIKIKLLMYPCTKKI